MIGKHVVDACPTATLQRREYSRQWVVGSGILRTLLPSYGFLPSHDHFHDSEMRQVPL